MLKTPSTGWVWDIMSQSQRRTFVENCTRPTAFFFKTLPIPYVMQVMPVENNALRTSKHAAEKCPRSSVLKNQEN
jgi:hypothetical protein